MKYNRSEIMKKAWHIKKANNTTISVALREAWAEAKCENTTTMISVRNEQVEFSFPKLTGTEKQIAYAEDLRRKSLHMYCGHFPKAFFDRKGLDYATEIVKIYKSKRGVDLSTTSAKEIIEALA